MREVPASTGSRSKSCPIICVCTGCVCARNCLPDVTSRSCRTQPRADLQIARKISDRVEGLLPPRRNAGRLCRHRRLGPPSPSRGAAQTLEARACRLPRTDRAWPTPRCGQTNCHPRPALVAHLDGGAQQGVAERSLQTAGSTLPRKLTSTHRTARCGPACRVVWQGTRTTSAPLCRSPSFFERVRSEAKLGRNAPREC